MQLVRLADGYVQEFNEVEVKELLKRKGEFELADDKKEPADDKKEPADDKKEPADDKAIKRASK